MAEFAIGDRVKVVSFDEHYGSAGKVVEIGDGNPWPDSCVRLEVTHPSDTAPSPVGGDYWFAADELEHLD